MKKLIPYIVFVMLTASIFADTKKIVQDSEGKFIEASFNTQGVIEKLEGTVNVYSVVNLDIKAQNDFIKIHTKYSGDGCFDIEIQNHGDYLTLTKIFTANKVFKPRDNLTYDIFFNDNDVYFVKDAYVTIRKDDRKSHVTNSSDSYLPMLEYKGNVCIQHFGSFMPVDDIGSRKYDYSTDKKTVVCSHIMPGDVWEKYMTATVFDFKSEDKAVNLINYIILYNYDYQLGVMFFPILFDLGDEASAYIETEITADSYLTEGKVRYTPENLKITAKGTPWVEGKKGDGLGSKIMVRAKSAFSILIISNGFDSEKKTTYYNNNRVKRIKIRDASDKNRFIVAELPDTTEPFEIKLPFKTKQLEIEIQDVYKGKKYDDTCLNYILVK